MKLGKVLTYKDVTEAEKIIGKKVVYSNCFKSINNYQDCLGIANDLGPLILNGVSEGAGLYYPFRLAAGTVVQFIREIIEDEPEEPRYEPYDLSDKEVRGSLRGRWFMDEYDNEVPVSLFDYHKNRNVWQVNGYSSKSFLEKCKWLDGTPCGRMVDQEMSSPVPTRDGKEDEK